jgi:hypothetical protein
MNNFLSSIQYVGGGGAHSGQHFSILNFMQRLNLKRKLYIVFECWRISVPGFFANLKIGPKVARK